MGGWTQVHPLVSGSQSLQGLFGLPLTSSLVAQQLWTAAGGMRHLAAPFLALDLALGGLQASWSGLPPPARPLPWAPCRPLPSQVPPPRGESRAAESP